MPALMTVLQAVNDASMEIGIRQTALSQALGSKDEDVVQMTSLLTAVADEVMLEEVYQDVLGDGNWILTRDGRYLNRPQADDDMLLFDGRLAINGLKYKFLQAKGLEFGEQMRDFISRQNKLAVRSNDRVLDLDTDGGRVL